MLLNGATISFDQPPIIENGKTLVPLRAIFEALGAEVSWEPNTQTVTIATTGQSSIPPTETISNPPQENNDFSALTEGAEGWARAIKAVSFGDGKNAKAGDILPYGNIGISGAVIAMFNGEAWDLQKAIDWGILDWLHYI